MGHGEGVPGVRTRKPIFPQQGFLNFFRLDRSRNFKWLSDQIWVRYPCFVFESCLFSFWGSFHSYFFALEAMEKLLVTLFWPETCLHYHSDYGFNFKGTFVNRACTSF